MLYDAAVIGAGPAGSTAAWKLGKLGWDVALFERDEFAGQSSVCAGGLNIGIAKELNLPDHVIEKKMKGMVVRDKNRVIRQNKQAGCFTIQRRVFDKYLAGRASKVCSYFPSTSIDSVTLNNGNWTLESDKKKIKARVVVFADGAVSRIRKNLEIGFQPDKKNLFVAAMIREFPAKETQDYLDIIYDEKVSPIGYGWMFPKKNHVNIGLGFLSKAKCDSKKSMDYLIDKYYPQFSGKTPALERSALVPLGLAKKISDPKGLITVGDAGGFVEPFSGEGINFGILSSFIASEAIDQALEKNNKKLLQNFDETLKSVGWYKLFKMQSMVLKAITNPFLFHQFFFRFYAKGNYDKILSTATNFYRHVKRK